MTVLVVVCAVLLLVGGSLALVRAERGPSTLDRTVALDVLVTALVGAFALYAALARRADVVPILVVLSLVGFVGSVTIARFAAVEPAGEGRVLSREEAAELAAQEARLAEDDDLTGEHEQTGGVPREEARQVAESSVERPEPFDEHGGAAEGEVR